jgi:hypothetical protein
MATDTLSAGENLADADGEPANMDPVMPAATLSRKLRLFMLFLPFAVVSKSESEAAYYCPYMGSIL